MTQTDNRAIVATPLNGHIGAEISNIDLGRPLAQADFDGLQAALARYEVLVFRDQDISLEAQIAFAKRFGNLSTHPFATNLPDVPEVIEFDNSGRNPAGPTDSWHSDETFRARPPMATILRAKVVPPYGGETVFASMTAEQRSQLEWSILAKLDQYRTINEQVDAWFRVNDTDSDQDMVYPLHLDYLP